MHFFACGIGFRHIERTLMTIGLVVISSALLTLAMIGVGALAFEDALLACGALCGGGGLFVPQIYRCLAPLWWESSGVNRAMSVNVGIDCEAARISSGVKGLYSIWSAR